MTKTIKSPKCHQDTTVDISRAIDADAEVFVCEHCKYVFRYVGKPQYATDEKK